MRVQVIDYSTYVSVQEKMTIMFNAGAKSHKPAKSGPTNKLFRYGFTSACIVSTNGEIVF